MSVILQLQNLLVSRQVKGELQGENWRRSQGADATTGGQELEQGNQPIRKIWDEVRSMKIIGEKGLTAGQPRKWGKNRWGEGSYSGPDLWGQERLRLGQEINKERRRKRPKGHLNQKRPRIRSEPVYPNSRPLLLMKLIVFSLLFAALYHRGVAKGVQLHLATSLRFSHQAEFDTCGQNCDNVGNYK